MYGLLHLVTANRVMWLPFRLRKRKEKENPERKHESQRRRKYLSLKEWKKGLFGDSAHLLRYLLRVSK